MEIFLFIFISTVASISSCKLVRSKYVPDMWKLKKINDVESLVRIMVKVKSNRFFLGDKTMFYFFVF